jgi:hypothetical protein
MWTTRTNARLGKGLLASAAIAMLTGALAGSVGADPAQLTAFVGVGSDTTQDVLNGLAGKSGLNFYTPVQTSSGQQLVSFDAINPANPTDTCITTKTGAPTILRPNGSGNGVRALSRSLDGGNWGVTGACGTVAGGLIKVDFARSSAGPSSSEIAAGTQLAYVPMGRDGIGFAYWAPSGVTPVTSLTRAELTSIFTSATRVVKNGVTIIPCGIQTGSGTYAFWNTVTTASTSQDDTATSQCNALTFTSGLGATGTGRVQESDAPALKSKGEAFAAANPAVTNFQVIVGFSGGAFIAKTNGVAGPSTIGTGVDMGSISNNGSGTDLGKPYSGTGTSLVPVAAYYADSVFGRTVYNVLPTSRINSSFGNVELKEMFRTYDRNGNGSVEASEKAEICKMISTINTFGFAEATNCGDSTTLLAGYKSGNG